MGKTFVFNAGKRLPPPVGTLVLTHGLFFDGTLNNRRNTEIYKKIKGVDEYEGQTATKEEREIFNRFAMERKIINLLKKTEIGDNSYFNDFSNVARKYMCCEKEIYSLYVEGIGTVDERGDNSAGAGWGRGTIGIIAKVKSGCQKLAEKILAKYNNKTTTIEVTVDIFGFSRGSAAARNFTYNLQKKAYSPGYYLDPQTRKLCRADHDGSAIKENWLKDGLLPPMGHFGTALLEAGIDREMVEEIQLKVRFLGVYDTVASFDPVNLFPDFKKHIEKLHLHELGKPRKAVQFTAMNEHRENFSLTPLKIGIEKEFPGVHSDIGGSYNNAVETVKELETSSMSKKNLESFEEELISEHWYKKSELKITGKIAYWALQGTRNIKKTYSYIPFILWVLT